jgi:hypothetical protein
MMLYTWNRPEISHFLKYDRYMSWIFHTYDTIQIPDVILIPKSIISAWIQWCVELYGDVTHKVLHHLVNVGQMAVRGLRQRPCVGTYIWNPTHLA